MGARSDPARNGGLLGAETAHAIVHRPTSGGECREVVLRMREPLFAKLVEQARKRNRTPAAWALELFQAAWTARVAPTGDGALDAAVAKLDAPAKIELDAATSAGIAALSADLRTAQARLMDAERIAEDRREKIAELAAEMVDLRTRRLVAERQRDEHMISLGAAEERCGDLASRLEEARETVARHERDAEDSADVVERLTGDVERQRAMIAELEARIAEATRLPSPEVAPATPPRKDDAMQALTPYEARRARTYRSYGMSVEEIAASMMISEEAVDAALRGGGVMAARKPPQLCVVSIGGDEFLMTLPDGLKLVEIMTRALLVERRWGGDLLSTYKTRPDLKPPVNLSLVQPSQIEDTSDQPWRRRGRLEIEGPR